ncbi:MAG: photosystem II complex extrinsic protein PsbU [Spirulina sp. DLM2.Bin59]|nr:MAG: photosystem II complex extrinsic protein PsbU [Spirulina sp. DLM2.Bin59]
MKRLINGLLVVVLIMGVFFWGAQPSQAAETTYRNNADVMLQTEFGAKIDLNNTNVRAFRKLRGFYPVLAQKIVKNAPYDEVKDVLNIPGLSETQKERLQANLEAFTVLDAVDVFTEGDDRLNNGIYD